MNYCSYFIKDKALFGSYPTQQSVEELEQEGVRYFVDLTQKQTDALLKRMLYEKLCIDKPSSKKKTHKKHKKKYASSSSDSSDTDTDSE